MQYITVEQLNHDIKNILLPQIPDDVNLIVAIPRDGLVVGTLLSLYRGIPLTDVEGFLNRKIYRTGIKLRQRPEYYSDINAILLVDDTVCTGASMREALKLLKPSKVKTYTMVAYAVHPEIHIKAGILDFYAKEVPVFLYHYEWTLGDAPLISKRTAIDFDGILCPSPTKEEDDGGVLYLEFLEKTPLKIRPIKIGTIVTGRLEKYREPTVEWLKKHNIEYDNLIMRPDNEPNHAKFKAAYYKKSNALLFIESSDRQAREIARLSGKPVISYETNRLYGG